MSTHSTTVDLVLEKAEWCPGKTTIQGRMREVLGQYALTGRIVNEDGPAGHPLVRLRGSMRDLTKFVTEVMEDATLAERIKPIERVVQ